MKLLKYIEELPKFIRKASFMAADMMVIIISYMLTNIFKETKVDFLSRVFISSVCTALVVYMVVFLLMHIYRLTTRYSSAEEYFRIAISCIGSIVLVSGIKYIVNYSTMSVITNSLAGVFVLV